MRSRHSALTTVVLLGAAVLGGCRSDGDAAAPTTPVPTTPASTDPAANESPPASSDAPDPGSTAPDATSAPSVGTIVDGTRDEPSPAPATVPEGADEVVLSDGFSDDSATWGDGGDWQVDIPGEATASVIDGVGVMETDQRGTHEWVRAVAGSSTHVDATLFARVTPVRSDEGTVFVGLRGDGEWRDNFLYLPQTGVVLEYAYSPVFLGEVVLIVLDGPNMQRIGPVDAPVLVDGESAHIRFEVVGDTARAKVWRAGDTEPSVWSIEADVAAADGVVQISYRDGVARSVAWDELTLHVWP